MKVEGTGHELGSGERGGYVEVGDGASRTAAARPPTGGGRRTRRACQGRGRGPAAQAATDSPALGFDSTSGALSPCEQIEHIGSGGHRRRQSNGSISSRPLDAEMSPKVDSMGPRGEQHEWLRVTKAQPQPTYCYGDAPAARPDRRLLRPGLSPGRARRRPQIKRCRRACTSTSNSPATRSAPTGMRAGRSMGSSPGPASSPATPTRSGNISGTSSGGWPRTSMQARSSIAG